MSDKIMIPSTAAKVLNIERANDGFYYVPKHFRINTNQLLTICAEYESLIVSKLWEQKQKFSETL